MQLVSPDAVLVVGAMSWMTRELGAVLLVAATAGVALPTVVAVVWRTVMACGTSRIARKEDLVPIGCLKDDHNSVVGAKGTDFWLVRQGERVHLSTGQAVELIRDRRIIWYVPGKKWNQGFHALIQRIDGEQAAIARRLAYRHERWKYALLLLLFAFAGAALLCSLYWSA